MFNANAEIGVFSPGASSRVLRIHAADFKERLAPKCHISAGEMVDSLESFHVNVETRPLQFAVFGGACLQVHIRVFGRDSSAGAADSVLLQGLDQLSQPSRNGQAVVVNESHDVAASLGHSRVSCCGGTTVWNLDVLDRDRSTLGKLCYYFSTFFRSIFDHNYV